MSRFENLISLSDAAKKYNKGESTLRILIRNGRFNIGTDCMKFGKQWVFDEDALIKKYGKVEVEQ